MLFHHFKIHWAQGGIAILVRGMADNQIEVWGEIWTVDELYQE